jgi:hypothetical protein
MTLTLQAICSSIQVEAGGSNASGDANNSVQPEVEGVVATDEGNPIDLESVKISVPDSADEPPSSSSVPATSTDSVEGGAEAAVAEESSAPLQQSQPGEPVINNPEADAQSLRALLAENGLLELWMQFQADVLSAFVSKYMSEFGGVEELRNMPPPALSQSGERFAYGADDYPNNNNNNVDDDFEFEDFDNSGAFKWDAFGVRNDLLA